MDSVKSYLYKKELKPSEYREFQRETDMIGYYELFRDEKGITICCWIVDEEHARNVGWIPCSSADIKRYQDLYVEKPLGELDQIAIKSASEAGFKRVKDNLGY